MAPATQGSGVAATLGYGTESRWDSRQRMAAGRQQVAGRPMSATVRMNNKSFSVGNLGETA
jgi:hypothetical protein